MTPIDTNIVKAINQTEFFGFSLVNPDFGKSFCEDIQATCPSEESVYTAEVSSDPLEEISKDLNAVDIKDDTENQAEIDRDSTVTDSVVEPWTSDSRAICQSEIASCMISAPFLSTAL